MASLSARLTASMDVSFTGDHEFGGPVFNQSMKQVIDLATGTGANQADIIWMDERTLASGASENIDLTSAPTNPDNLQKVIVKPVAVLIINAPRTTSTPNTTNLFIGGAGNTFLGIVGSASQATANIRPGGAFFMFNPDSTGMGTVVDASSDLLRVNNSAGASAVYQIGILARTA